MLTDPTSSVYSNIIDEHANILIANAITVKLNESIKIDDNVKSMITTVITSHMKDNYIVEDHMKNLATNAVTTLLKQTSNGKEDEFLKLCNKIGKTVTDRIHKSGTEACEVIQDTADNITSKA